MTLTTWFTFFNCKQTYLLFTIKITGSQNVYDTYVKYEQHSLFKHTHTHMQSLLSLLNYVYVCILYMYIVYVCIYILQTQTWHEMEWSSNLQTTWKSQIIIKFVLNYKMTQQTNLKYKIWSTLTFCIQPSKLK